MYGGMIMKIAICSDHRGYELKTELVKKMLDKNIQCEDFGCFNTDRCDYPKFAFKVGEAVRDNKCDFGVVICGSGDGVSIAANKVKGIRCVCVKDISHVERARQHVNVNVLAFAAEETTASEAMAMVEKMISTDFLGDRYEERLEMIEEYEQK